MYIRLYNKNPTRLTLVKPEYFLQQLLLVFQRNYYATHGPRDLHSPVSNVPNSAVTEALSNLLSLSPELATRIEDQGMVSTLVGELRCAYA